MQVQLELAKQTRDANYDDYVIIMKENFNEGKVQDSFQVGDLVAYYIGDRSSTNQKLQRRFTGPWKITRRIPECENTVEIEHEDGTKFACHVSMLKRYYAHKFVPLLELTKSERAKRKAKQKQIREERKQLSKPLGRVGKKQRRARKQKSNRANLANDSFAPSNHS